MIYQLYYSNQHQFEPIRTQSFIRVETIATLWERDNIDWKYLKYMERQKINTVVIWVGKKTKVTQDLFSASFLQFLIIIFSPFIQFMWVECYHHHTPFRGFLVFPKERKGALKKYSKSPSAPDHHIKKSKYNFDSKI